MKIKTNFSISWTSPFCSINLKVIWKWLKNVCMLVFRPTTGDTYSFGTRKQQHHFTHLNLKEMKIASPYAVLIIRSVSLAPTNQTLIYLIDSQDCFFFFFNSICFIIHLVVCDIYSIVVLFLVVSRYVENIERVKSRKLASIKSQTLNLIYLRLCVYDD